jgi:hypothetical protein
MTISFSRTGTDYKMVMHTHTRHYACIKLQRIIALLCYFILHVWYIKSHISGVVVSVLATGPRGCRFKPGKGVGFLNAIKILSTTSSRMESKAVRSHVVKNSFPTGMNRINSHSLHPSPTAPEVSGDGQNGLVVKLSSPCRSRLLIASHSLLSGESTTDPRLQC